MKEETKLIRKIIEFQTRLDRWALLNVNKTGLNLIEQNTYVYLTRFN